MKKLLSLFVVFALVACGSNTGKSESKLKVGMVTDAGTIDDKSFNQGTWEGILLAQKELGIEAKYLQPDGTTATQYLTQISNLVDTGFEVVITPGFLFEAALTEAQAKYPDAKFIGIDVAPAETGKNAQGIFFAEQEAGFIAAIATAIERPDANVGFIGGIAVPAVQKFNWGFQQGIKYANENLGTNVKMEEKNFVYANSFSDLPLGQSTAAGMFENGVDVIFTAAGGVGNGAINEAKQRRSKTDNPEDVWIVGVDSDQYETGVYADGKSVILTSAVKRVDLAAFNVIESILNDKFEPGIVVLDAKTNSVGIPEKNPNLSEETQKKTAEIYKLIQDGKIIVEGGDGVQPASAPFK